MRCARELVQTGLGGGGWKRAEGETLAVGGRRGCERRAMASCASKREREREMKNERNRRKEVDVGVRGTRRGRWVRKIEGCYSDEERKREREKLERAWVWRKERRRRREKEREREDGERGSTRVDKR